MIDDPADRWDPWPVAIELTPGPSRTYDSDAANEPPPRPILGFTYQPTPDDDRPDVYEQLRLRGAYVYDSAGNVIGRVGPADESPDGELAADYEPVPLLWNGDNA